MMMHKHPVLVATLLGLASPAANAQTPTPADPVELGAYGTWKAYKRDRGGALSCYVVASPKQMLPAGAKRDPVYFFITARPAEKISGEISLNNGYPFREGVKGMLSVGKQNFDLVTAAQGAWLELQSQEPLAVAALRKTREAVVKGTSRRGTQTTDRYDLNGLNGALDRMKADCP